MFGKVLTPEQQLQKDRDKAEKERRRIERARIAEEQRVDRARREKERFDAMPIYVVRETREVSVKAENMNDAIALASAAFKEGQDSDGGIKWGKPFGVDGDTIDMIRTTNIKAIED